MSNEKKMCALLRQTWYETAKANLQPEDRLRFYEACFEYEFNDLAPANDLPFAARLLFDMVKNDLDGDKSRAAERAERNRRNGLLGGRPKSNGLQQVSENPDKPSGISGLHIQNNTKQNSTEQNNMSLEGDNEDTHTFFDCLLNFFERGCSDPYAEALKFWNYYAALGWKTAAGGDIVNRFAMAKAWKLRDCSKALMVQRRKYAELMHKITPTETILISGFSGMFTDNDKNVIELIVSDKIFIDTLEGKYLTQVREWMPKSADGKAYTLQYRIATDK